MSGNSSSNRDPEDRAESVRADRIPRFHNLFVNPEVFGADARRRMVEVVEYREIAQRHKPRPQQSETKRNIRILAQPGRHVRLVEAVNLLEKAPFGGEIAAENPRLVSVEQAAKGRVLNPEPVLEVAAAR